MRFFLLPLAGYHTAGQAAKIQPKWSTDANIRAPWLLIGRVTRSYLTSLGISHLFRGLKNPLSIDARARAGATISSLT